jgi:hypothetical protein
MLDDQWLAFLDPECWGSRLCKDLQVLLRTWHENDPAYQRYVAFLKQERCGDPTHQYMLKSKCMKLHGLDPAVDLHLEWQVELIHFNPDLVEAFSHVPTRIALLALALVPTDAMFRKIGSPSLEFCLQAARANDDLIAFMDPDMATTVCDKLNIYKPYVRTKLGLY